MTIEEMIEGQSRLGNRAIASVFTAMKIIEHWGSGIPRVIQECKNYGLREPELVELGVSFRVNIYRNVETKDENEYSDAQSSKSNIESSKSNIKGPKSNIETVKRILSKSKMTSKQIANIMLLYEQIGVETVRCY